MARVKMGLKSLDDERGFARGCGHYTNSESFISRHVADYGSRSDTHDIWDRVDVSKQAGPGSDVHGFHEGRWRPGPVKQGSSPPRYAPKGNAGLKSPKAASPSGKYAKKGGKGQRSGA